MNMERRRLVREHIEDLKKQREQSSKDAERRVREEGRDREIAHITELEDQRVAKHQALLAARLQDDRNSMEIEDRYMQGECIPYIVYTRFTMCSSG